MKIILVGPSGFIGSNILRRALRNPRISRIIVVTRKPMPDELGSPKIWQAVVREEQDWMEWSNHSFLQWFEGASACIWCIGGRPKAFETRQEFFHATYTYPLAFARALATVALAPRFRLCYLSCWGADLTESKFRPIDKLHAYMKGKTEKALFGVIAAGALSYSIGWELYTFRPGSVLNKDGMINRNGFKGIKGMVVPTIEISLLEAAVVDVAMHGYGEDGMSIFFENREIISQGIEAQELEAEELKLYELERKRAEATAVMMGRRSLRC